MVAKIVELEGALRSVDVVLFNAIRGRFGPRKVNLTQVVEIVGRGHVQVLE